MHDSAGKGGAHQASRWRGFATLTKAKTKTITGAIKTITSARTNTIERPEAPFPPEPAFPSPHLLPRCQAPAWLDSLVRH